MTPRPNGVKKILKEALSVWLGVVVVLSLLSFVPIPFINHNVSFVTAVLLLYVPLILSVRKKERIDYFDFSASNFLTSLRDALALAVVIFVPASLIVWFFPFLHFAPRPFLGTLEFFAIQLLMVALPEEFFFRGYLQGKFNLVFGRPWQVLGVRFGWGLFLASALFALSHSIIRPQAWHPLIFFPSLLFGLLRDKNGLITSSLFFHAFCNLFSYFVVISF